MRLALLLCLASATLVAAEAPAAPDAGRDGSHDFDPLLGRWKFHLKRRLKPLTGSNTWIDLEGTGDCRKLWDGAMIEQAIFDGADTHIEGSVERLYNPQTHQWRLYWANRKTGIMDPPQVGRFKDGRGEFFAKDTVDGKAILVRFAWTALNTKSPHFEQSYSADGGKTWEVNWITDQTKVDDQLTPYDMIPATIGDAVLAEIQPTFELRAIYKMPGGKSFQLSVMKGGSMNPPECQSTAGRKTQSIKVGSHDACYSSVSGDSFHWCHIEWLFRDYRVLVLLNAEVDFAAGLHILAPRAELAAAWLDSFFARSGPSLEANRAAIAPAIAAMHAHAKWLESAPHTIDKLHKGALEIGQPDHWYEQP
jgi:hypothetical protein